jgi:hypothetical protein
LELIKLFILKKRVLILIFASKEGENIRRLKEKKDGK